MGTSALDVAREIYEAFNRGDMERVNELFDDEIEWEEPAGYFVPEARGKTRGKSAVFAIFGRYPELLRALPRLPKSFTTRAMALSSSPALRRPSRIAAESLKLRLSIYGVSEMAARRFIAVGRTRRPSAAFCHEH